MYVNDELFATIRPQFRRIVAEWQAKVPWIQAVAITEKTVGGEPTGEDAIVFYVGDKVSKDRLDTYETFPEIIEIPKTNIVLPTDVVPSPEFRFLSVPSCSSIRPAFGGDCIGPLGVGVTGTLGAVLKERATGKPYLLTASHTVLNKGGTLRLGQMVCHPAMGATIGKVDRSITWSTTNIMPADAALVDVTICTDAKQDLTGIPQITGAGVPIVKQPVQFKGVFGVKTAIVACEATMTVTVESVYKFENTFCLINVDAKPGDSGSVVVNAAGEVLGIVFATNGLLTCCSSIDAVAKALCLSDFDF